MIQKILITASASLFLAACTQGIDQAKIPVKGLVACVSPIAKNISFNTDQLKSITVIGVSDPYVSVELNGVETNLYESQGWVCTNANGKKESFFQRG
jgi:hypothetical protein